MLLKSTTKRYPMTTTNVSSCTKVRFFGVIVLLIATGTTSVTIVSVKANEVNNPKQTMTGLSSLLQQQYKSRVVETPTTSLQIRNHQQQYRRDQQEFDPCIPLLEEVNTCLPLAKDPTCDICVTTAFDQFVSNITMSNFTCTDFTTGVCPIVYQQCSICAPCNTQLESYFNCLLNDISNNECQVVYCDPLKDFSITPDTCKDDLAFATSCIGSECLQCLGETINTGDICTDYETSVCNAMNIDCLSCLQCRNVVEPWLRCIGTESKACPTFQCGSMSGSQPTITPPATVPISTIIVPTTPTFSPTFLPTPVPVTSIVSAPTTTAPISSPTITLPSIEGPAPVLPAPTTVSRDITSSSFSVKSSALLYATVVALGIWLCL